MLSHRLTYQFQSMSQFIKFRERFRIYTANAKTGCFGVYKQQKAKCVVSYIVACSFTELIADGLQELVNDNSDIVAQRTANSMRAL